MKRDSSDSVVPTIRANLLDATQEYIAQQCNCYTVRAHGLAATISKHHGNPYETRRPVAPNRNLAVKEDRDVPGTIRILDNRVICMFAQLCPGKPGRYKSYPDYHIDTYTQRIEWFQQCLEAIQDMAPKSVAFPWTIGCGLAGGDWDTYKKMIEDFAEHSGIPCMFYRID